MRVFPLLLTAPFVAIVLAGGTLSAADKPVDYLKQIKPIFTKHCYSCHAADKQESGYRLDTAKLAIRGGDRGAGVVPGKSAKSILYQALIGKGDVSRMPAEKPRLPAAQIALIKRWIDEGAKSPKSELAQASRKGRNHWAFQPVRRPKVPKVIDDWVKNPIDRFVVARLRKEKLRPSREADRATLIRRLSLDLRGLPPSLKEIEQFKSDTKPGAYERLVDRLLASPQFGERWGRHWLDVARYADSNGFTIDGPRNIWKYRDWVIRAVNRDVPFDRFVTEQLAGDLLPALKKGVRPADALQHLIATGFHRNTLINQEGGTDQEQFRIDAVADRINTSGVAFLGLTVGCARCHEHKYDPISQREYYDLFAIFNNCDEPKIRVPTARQSTESKRLAAALAAAKKPLAARERAFLKGQADWEQRMRAQISATSGAAFAAEKPASVSTAKGTTLNPQPDKSIFVDFSHPPNDTYTIELKPGLKQITAVRLEALTHPSLPKKGPGYASNGNFVLTEFELWVSPVKGSSNAKPRRVKLRSAVADHSQSGFPVIHAIDGKPKTGWAIGVRKGSSNVNREAIFFPQQPVALNAGERLVVKLKHDVNRNYMLGRFRLSVSDAPADALSIPGSIRKILAIEEKKRKKAQSNQLVAAYLDTDPMRKPLAAAVDALEKQKGDLDKAIPTTMVLKERSKPRTSHIHIRGDFLRKGAVVNGGVPQFLPPLKTSSKRPTRLEFARWLFDRKNPLTARVTVNRYWQRLFGQGIVATENDFGTQGIPPTHPELLDWLALEFQRREWSVKSMLKLIVTSATYRQSSRMRPELLKRDQGNRLLARQSRLRLEAETIRDACLEASGLLSEKMLGPGIYPPQPKGIYVLTQQKKNWPESKGIDRHRRGLYTYFWRSSPYPFLPTFDAPDANTSCTRRSRSNTPLQALTLANDAAFVEIARGFAGRILREAPPYDDARLRFAFAVSLSREPSERERRILNDFLGSHRRKFAKDEKQARLLAAENLPKNTKPAEAAAWTAVARVLLNLDEMITRE